jgi:hypothetical protein
VQPGPAQELGRLGARDGAAAGAVAQAQRPLFYDGSAKLVGAESQSQLAQLGAETIQIDKHMRHSGQGQATAGEKQQGSKTPVVCFWRGHDAIEQQALANLLSHLGQASLLLLHRFLGRQEKPE